MIATAAKPSDALRNAHRVVSLVVNCRANSQHARTARDTNGTAFRDLFARSISTIATMDSAAKHAESHIETIDMMASPSGMRESSTTDTVARTMTTI